MDICYNCRQPVESIEGGGGNGKNRSDGVDLRLHPAQIKGAKHILGGRANINSFELLEFIGSAGIELCSYSNATLIRFGMHSCFGGNWVQTTIQWLEYGMCVCSTAVKGFVGRLVSRAVVSSTLGAVLTKRATSTNKINPLS